MSNEKFELDVAQVFADAGSFYISSMKGKNRDTALTFVGCGLATNLLNNVNNLILNLSNTSKDFVLCRNYGLTFKPFEIDSNADLPTLLIGLDININTIDVVLKTKQKAFTFIAGIDFIQEIETDRNNSRFGLYKNIKFLSDSIVGKKFSNLEKFTFNINGTYTRESVYRQSYLKSYIGADICPLGQNMFTISSYIGGSNQSIEDFARVLNALNTIDYLEGEWEIKNIQDIVAANNEVVYSYVIVQNTVSNEIKCLILNRPHLGEVGTKINNSFYPSPIEVFYVLNDKTKTWNKTTIPEAIDKNLAYIAYASGNPQVFIGYHSKLLNSYRIVDLKNIATHLIPIGYTIASFIDLDI